MYDYIKNNNNSSQLVIMKLFCFKMLVFIVCILNFDSLLLFFLFVLVGLVDKEIE